MLDYIFYLTATTLVEFDSKYSTYLENAINAINKSFRAMYRELFST
jgi:hypothetical protein